MTKPKDNRRTGTAEWADSTRNICQGCSNACLYCYGRYSALRFGRIANGEDWTNEHVDLMKANGYGKGGRLIRARSAIMFPSTHDITNGTVDACESYLRRLLGAGNQVLIVTKPALRHVERLCDALRPWQPQILWRFTIGCLSGPTRQFWEPHAPPIDDRLAALAAARAAGYATSVSAEPLLEPWAAIELVGKVQADVSETIWVGAARDLRARTAWCYRQYGASLEEMTAALEAWQTPAAIRFVAEELRARLPAETWAKVRFKDSYAAALCAAGWRIEAGRVCP